MTDSNMRDSRRKEFFNQRADQWMDMCYGDSERGTRASFESAFGHLFAPIPLTEGDHVLDVGCGSGVLVPHFLARIGPTGRLYEVDYAENMIEVNRRLHQDKRITFMVSDVQHVALPPTSCDLVMCFACFPHLAQKVESMKRMSGVLKEGGYLAVAHLLSSEQLNDTHRKHEAVAQDTLPGKEAMHNLFGQADLTVESHTDRPGFYLILGRKQAGGRRGAI